MESPEETPGFFLPFGCFGNIMVGKGGMYLEKIRFGIIGYGTQGKFYSAILTGAELPGIGRIPQPEGCVLSAVGVRRKEALEQLQQIPGVSYFADWKEMIDSAVAVLFHSEGVFRSGRQEEVYENLTLF